MITAASAKAAPGRRDELIAVLVDGLRAGGDDCGLLAYSISTVPEDEDTIWLTQLWVDKDAQRCNNAFRAGRSSQPQGPEFAGSAT